jgi:hypothetical protein
MNGVEPAVAAMPAPRDIEPSRRRALFLVDAPSTIEQQAVMVSAFDGTGEWDSYFMPPTGMEIGEHVARLAARIWHFADPAVAGNPAVTIPDENDVAGAKAPPGILRKKITWLLHHPLMSIPRELALGLLLGVRWRRDRAQARKRLSLLKPSVIITGQDRTDAALPIVAAASDLDIPVILVPRGPLVAVDGASFTRGADPSVALDRHDGGRPASNIGQRLLNRLVGWIGPRHVVRFESGRVLYRPAHWHIGAVIAGLLPRNSWHQGTRFTDAIVVSGNDDVETCQNAGIPRERLVPIGNPALQLQFDKWKERPALRRELGVPFQEPLLMATLAQFYEHHMLSRDEHFAYVEGLLAALSGHCCRVFLSLHPKMDPSHYRQRIANAGLHLLDRPLSEVVSAADLFVGSAYTSTMRWALALGIPSVNFDYLAMNHSTYRGMSDYPTLASFDALRSWVGARVREFHEGSRPARGDQLPIGLICDGRFKERFLELVDKTIAAKSR